MTNKSILIFGVGPLQKSLIEKCKEKGLFTVGIDPDEKAPCKDLVDVFEVVGSQDYEKTLKIAQKYKVSGIITAATDKPLVMMARITETLHLSFFSIETAKCSTDKFLMKQKFQEFEIPCAKGFLVKDIKDDLAQLPTIEYPVILKPRDNSGSRGVIYCQDYHTLQLALKETFKYTKKNNVLIEEFIEGKEYSVEGIHYNGESHVIQITEKITTKFPYNVELGHIQPAELSNENKCAIQQLLNKIAKALAFDNCASHTELKINSKGIKVIETSPRLGGDFISSTLVPLSTGINMENILVDISIGKKLPQDYYLPKFNKSSGIIYFELPEGRVNTILNLQEINQIKGIQNFSFDLKVGDTINKITNSSNRYGYAIFQNSTKKELIGNIKKCNNILKTNIIVA
jgi:biotin carboxylase